MKNRFKPIKFSFTHFLTLPFVLLSIKANAQYTIDIREVGAQSGLHGLNTVPVQKAIDSVFSMGGGKVIIPKGKYVIGTIILKSNVTLQLNKGAELLGSTDSKDYFSISSKPWPALIQAHNAKKIHITGKGTIDGQGAELALGMDSLFYAGELDSMYYTFKEKRPVPHIRPMIIKWVSCTNSSVQGINIRNSASWVQYYALCKNLIIDEIKVNSTCYWNNDGIDIIDCRNVRITNSYFNSSDDGICLKSYPHHEAKNAFCDSIYIGNCVVRSSASAVKLGTSSYGGFKNITIEKIKVYDTFRSAIAIECYEPGTIENILVQDIVAKNTGNAIFIRLNANPYFTKKGYGVGSLKNVTIRNMKVTVPYEQPDYDYEMRGPALPFFHNVFPSSIAGMPNHYIENVHLENIKIIYPGRGNPAYANIPLYRIQDVPEKVEEYPEFSMFGELPSWGFFVRHVKNITFKNVRVKIKKPDYRPAFVFDDVQSVNLDAVEVKGDEKSQPFFFKNTKGIEKK
jgi:polygalacturonase